uniref:26S proteasome regulatory chain 4 n=1 Tax=Wuchereria bancrofti TaxID=6293 RepID=A0A1I8EI63_WUCBA
MIIVTPSAEYSAETEMINIDYTVYKMIGLIKVTHKYRIEQYRYAYENVTDIERKMGNQVSRPNKKGVAMPQHTLMKVARKPQRAQDTANKLPQVIPRRHCYLKFLRMSRIKDYLLLEKEFIQRQGKSGSISEQQRKERKTINALRGSPIALARIHELFLDEKHAVVVIEGNKREWYIPILSIVDKDLVRIGALVMVKAQGSLKNVPIAVVGVLHDSIDASNSIINRLEKAPRESFDASFKFKFKDIGGLEEQIQEIKETVELPLVHPEYYEEMGITAPKGVILYGEPGTGKTLLAKAVAHSTSATFIRVTGADLIQKNSELFRIARESVPCIIFIDEIDAVGTKRYDTTCGGEREVQRTMLELLNQLDGFESRGDVKVIMATNRIDVLDPALIRPGRIDRKIELPKPNEKTKLKIFQIHTAGMKIAANVRFEKYASELSLSGADCKAICTEAGMLALRAQRKFVCLEDFDKAMERVIMQKKSEAPEENRRVLLSKSFTSQRNKKWSDDHAYTHSAFKKVPTYRNSMCSLFETQNHQ